MDIPDLIAHEFSRNIGLISEAAQARLLGSRAAVVGAGGVGGIHLLTLARLGVGKFNIADMDAFERVNISRQFGAFHSTVGESKVRVLERMIKDINPAAEVRVFDAGLTPENADEFLEGADIFIDGIEFFEIDMRRVLFRKSREKGIYAMTAAPLGFGATLQIFSPEGMSFDDYFGIREDMPYLEKLSAFLSGLAVYPYHMLYIDPSKFSVARRTGPAVASACTLAASLVGTAAVKILTKAGKVKAAPHYIQFDMFLTKFKNGYLPWGGSNPLQILKKMIILRKMARLDSGAAGGKAR